MKKNILLILLVSFGFVATSNAQLFKYGANLGFNASNFKSDNFSSSTLSRFQGGIMAELKLPILLGVEADLKFSQRGAYILDEGYVLSYMDFPVLAKFYMLNIFSLQVGPQYSHLLSANYIDTDVKDELNSSSFSAVFGVGIDIFKIHTSIRYNLGLNNISSVDNTDIKNDFLQISVGYWFSKNKD
jgi:hypothetical protein